MLQPSERNRNKDWIWTSGYIQRGHQVASGMGVSPYPCGTIAMQLPYFQERGLDLSPFFPGTLNVSIAPMCFELIAPEYTFERLRWTDLHPPETFSFSHCCLEFGREKVAGMVYYPHPETKKVHFQDASTLEILAPRIAGIGYGDGISLALNARAARLFLGR